jgi:hypothetical protein
MLILNLKVVEGQLLREICFQILTIVSYLINFIRSGCSRKDTCEIVKLGE